MKLWNVCADGSAAGAALQAAYQRQPNSIVRMRGRDAESIAVAHRRVCVCARALATPMQFTRRVSCCAQVEEGVHPLSRSRVSNSVQCAALRGRRRLLCCTCTCTQVRAHVQLRILTLTTTSTTTTTYINRRHRHRRHEQLSSAQQHTSRVTTRTLDYSRRDAWRCSALEVPCWAISNSESSESYSYTFTSTSGDWTELNWTQVLCSRTVICSIVLSMSAAVHIAYSSSSIFHSPLLSSPFPSLSHAHLSSIFFAYVLYIAGRITFLRSCTPHVQSLSIE